ncbi:MAG TPA: phage tail protein [Candidatus Angelobacter sp.]
MASPGTRIDPYRGYNFRVEIDNTSVASFRECSGLTLNTDPVDYREGTDSPLSVRKLTGLRKYTNITLKRGYTQNQDLWKWYKNVINGVSDRRNGAIVLQDEQHNDVLRWNFVNAWICKWEGPTMNATSNDVAIETIEICPEQVALA